MSGEHTHPENVSSEAYTRYQRDVGDAFFELRTTVEWQASRLAALEAAVPVPVPETPSDETPEEPDVNVPNLPSFVYRLTFPSSGDDTDRELYPYQQAHPHGITFVPHPLFAGRGAAQHLLRLTDSREPVTGGYRAEYSDPLGIPKRPGEGDEYWTSFRFILDDQWDQGEFPSSQLGWVDRIIFQLTDSGSPIFSSHINRNERGDPFLWVRRKDESGDFHRVGAYRAIALNQVHDVVMHAVLSKHPDLGGLEWFFDGEKVDGYAGRTLAIRDTTYPKWGIYGQPTKILFDEVRLAKGNDLFEVMRIGLGA